MEPYWRKYWYSFFINYKIFIDDTDAQEIRITVNILYQSINIIHAWSTRLLIFIDTDNWINNTDNNIQYVSIFSPDKFILAINPSNVVHI